MPTRKELPNNSDSKTLDVKPKTRFTDRVTLRIDPETKKLLSGFKSKTGMTECQLIHALLTAYFYGVGNKLDLDVKSPTINLTIERVVQRVRRYGREYERGDVQVETVGTLERCAFGCAGRVVAKHHVWDGERRCVETYVCGKHHEQLKGRGISWSELGQGAT